MPYFNRTLDVDTPPVADGRIWLARALLEAADVNGAPDTGVNAWRCVAAASVEVDPKTKKVTGSTRLRGPISTSLAQLETGWYVVQYVDSGRGQFFTDAVLLSGQFATAKAPWPGDSAPPRATYGGA